MEMIHRSKCGPKHINQINIKWDLVLKHKEICFFSYEYNFTSKPFPVIHFTNKENCFSMREIRICCLFLHVIIINANAETSITIGRTSKVFGILPFLI